MPTVPPRIHRPGLRAAAVTLAAGLVLGLGACGRNSPGAPPPVTGSPSAGATSSPPGTTPSPTGKAPTPTVSSSALPRHEEVSAVGRVVEGLRPHCVVLQTTNRRYVLTGPEVRGLHMGERVAVVGVPRPELVSPCGAILVVSQVALR
jgi:hypothetical protein